MIDNDVEPFVRSTLDAAVKRDADRFGEALQAFPTDGALRAGLGIAAAVASVALRDAYHGELTDEDLQEAATKISEMESWARLSVAEVHAHLSGLLRGEVTSGTDGSVSTAFIVTASLVAASTRVSEDEHWFDYLDRVEAAIDQA